MSGFKRQRTDAKDDGYNTDDTVSDDEHSSHPQDEVHDSLQQEIEILKNEVRRLTRNLRNMPPTPPTERINKSGERLYIYEKVNDLYNNTGEKYIGTDLYVFRPLTRDVNKDEPVYDSKGNEIPTQKIEFGGKRRRTTHRKARKSGGNKKSCKRTKKR